MTMSFADVEKDAASAHDDTNAVQEAEEGEKGVKAQQEAIRAYKVEQKAWCESYSDMISAAVRAEGARPPIGSVDKQYLYAYVDKQTEITRDMMEGPKVWRDYWANCKRSRTIPNDLFAEDELGRIIRDCAPINKQKRSVPITPPPQPKAYGRQC